LAPDLALPRVIEAFALVLLDRAVECETGDRLSAAVRAVCLSAGGEVERAHAIADSLEAGAADSAPPPYLEAYHAWAGDVGETIRALTRAYLRTPNGPDFRIIESGAFDRVRTDRRFRAELDRLRTDVWTRVEREAARFGDSAVLPPLPARAQSNARASLPALSRAPIEAALSPGSTDHRGRAFLHGTPGVAF
ncbi:MAG: hypothetical protein L0271_26750, partial [Gemmatimonadetes bacterium]|nr:hypothetical protein [Gemmatimonadota bacterium]